RASRGRSPRRVSVRALSAGFGLSGSASCSSLDKRLPGSGRSWAPHGVAASRLMSTMKRTPRIMHSILRGGVMTRMKIGAVLLAASVAATVAMRSEAQSGRTLEELKAEAQARADRNAYPLIGLKPEEVREALARLTSLDRDEWAASWSRIDERYMAKKDFHQAWLYYSFARWPVPNSPGKQRAYDKALEAYLAYAKKY